jgi:hypothetical protein
MDPFLHDLLQLLSEEELIRLRRRAQIHDNSALAELLTGVLKTREPEFS